MIPLSDVKLQSPFGEIVTPLAVVVNASFGDLPFQAAQCTYRVVVPAGIVTLAEAPEPLLPNLVPSYCVPEITTLQEETFVPGETRQDSRGASQRPAADPPAGRDA